ncbi:MAG TPA: glycoside hydrolase family 13 protein [Acidimicrobiia bacterium]|nr:glycoside hydrolase family 13 protein [Acidimicrobiia bacterium]
MNATHPWWRHSVVYQVYIRSFADSNGDGTGDIAGLRSRLPYLASLGVDAIWVNPWYESPMHDGGYDVADYRSINPRFGTLDDAKLLIEETNRLGLRLLVDLVPNHTSSEHQWFRAALASGPASPERHRYHFVPGGGHGGEFPPNDWKSVFGGPAWTRVPDGEWYLHLFDASQPDLNWENPEVREEFESIIRHWMELGAAGFRVDVAHALVKEPGYPDLGEGVEELTATPHLEDHPHWNRPGIHEIVEEWRTVLDEYDDSVMIAEAWLPTWDQLVDYIRPGEYHQTFDFFFLQAPWEAEAMRDTVSEALETTARVGKVPTWVLSNHDVVRHATRYGLAEGVEAKKWLLDGDRSLLDADKGLQRARAAVLLMLALPGSVYLYQGEELGLPEVHDLPEGTLDDPVWERSGHTEKGRDGCRIPIPWEREGQSFGFGPGGSWLPQPDGWGELSVEAQDGVAGSTLELYRSALRIRAEKFVGDEQFDWIDPEPTALRFRRGGGVICVVNFGDSPIPLPAGRPLVASAPLTDGTVPPDTAVWVQT